MLEQQGNFPPGPEREILFEPQRPDDTQQHPDRPVILTADSADLQVRSVRVNVTDRVFYSGALGNQSMCILYCGLFLWEEGYWKIKQTRKILSKLNSVYTEFQGYI